MTWVREPSNLNQEVRKHESHFYDFSHTLCDSSHAYLWFESEFHRQNRNLSILCDSSQVVLWFESHSQWYKSWSMGLESWKHEMNP